MKRIGIALVVAIVIATTISITAILMPQTKQKVETTTKENISSATEENLSTKEIPQRTIQDEKLLENNIETEGLEYQGNVAYNGDYISDNISLGAYSGLTYYSQIDSRWKDKLYTVTGNSNQTIGSSGCGPTSAAMIVSSIKGTITPDTMAELFVKNGYRSSNNGTYLAAFRWVADYFNIGYEQTNSLDRVIELLRNNYYIVASCQSGLFTYGGHLIVLVGVEGNNIKIYDPYLYAGKFTTSTRNGKAEVVGNTVYVSIDNFRNYANARTYYAYKNEQENIKDNTVEVITQSYTRVVTAKSGLNVRSGPGTNYSVKRALTQGSRVTVYETSGMWARIGEGEWVYTQYLEDPTNTSNTTTNSSNGSNTLGVYTAIVTAKTGVNIRTGAGTNYKKVGAYTNGSTITILETKNGWGRTNKGWVYLRYTVLSSQNIVGNIEILKQNCYLYSNSNLTGTRYYYLKNTSVVVLENVSAGIDKVRVRQTGREAYVSKDNYR